MKPTISLLTFALILACTPSLSDPTSRAAEPRKRLVPMAGESYFDRRVGDEKARALRESGGTDESEAAVAAALKWLAQHQLEDGGWHFDHQHGACKGRCSHAGALTARIAATSMALLPFLGAGHSHLRGEYKDVVARGLEFLVKQGHKSDESGLSFHEGGGSMYSHGLATLVLCEALGMTGDMTIQATAQRAVDFIVFAQDPIGGGWRYHPRVPGDTSVTGWQMLALLTAKEAGLEVPAATLTAGDKFLAAVAAEGGAFYGYTGPGRGAATSSIGLLCRMHLGWEHDAKPLETGVKWISAKGPQATAKFLPFYHDFYATQLLWHYGGERWDAWNKVLRDSLVAKQEKEGHAAGSWYVAGDYGAQRGGRLYCTSLATLTLQVYYRTKPIYARE